MNFITASACLAYGLGMCGVIASLIFADSKHTRDLDFFEIAFGIFVVSAILAIPPWLILLGVHYLKETW